MATMTTTKPDATGRNLITAEELLELHSKGIRGELIRGEFCETMSAGQEHGEVVFNLGIELGSFVKRGKLGRMMGSDSGVLLGREPDTVREPDIAFFASEKFQRGERVTGYSEVMPDLVVEVASPSDSRFGVFDKAQMWLWHGVRLVWTVYPNLRVIDVHRQDRSTVRLTEDDFLDGLDVLPGFTYAVKEVFESLDA